MKVLLLGSTDLTLALAKHLKDNGVELAGVISVPAEFDISYQSKMQNLRHQDMESWCAKNEVSFKFYEKPDDILGLQASLKCSFLLAAGWYHMVPKRVRLAFPKGAAGFHASILPELRGCAPLNWAILNGFSQSGVSMFELVSGVDEGLLYGQTIFDIDETDYIEDIVKKAELSICNLAVRVLTNLKKNEAKTTEQKGEVSFGLARLPKDGLINWSQSQAEIMRLIRAVSRPYAGAYTYLNNKKIIIYRANIPLNPPKIYGKPGQIAKISNFDLPLVLTKTDPITLTEVIYEDGSNAMADMLKSNNMYFSHE